MVDPLSRAGSSSGLSTRMKSLRQLAALGLMQQLAARGVRVGVDVSVIGFDDIWLAPVLTPALTTIRVPGAEAGAAAVRLLVRLMVEGVPSPAPRLRLPTELIVRATTGAAR